MNEENPADHVLLKLSSQLSALEKEKLREQLAGYINHLLLHDFNKLIQLLYRVDVNEEKLKQLLRENPQTDAALLISDLIILRHEEKAKTREAFKKNEKMDDEEKW